MASKTQQTAERRRKAMETLYRRYRHRANVTGFDIGYRWTEGKPTAGLCARIHVTSKIPEQELAETELFPKEIDGIPVDVITGPYEARNELGTQAGDDIAAILSGTACRRASGGTGTIGAVAIDEGSGQPGILSNWHVLATYRGAPGDLIYNAGTAPRPIARLSQSMLSRHGDAAFAAFEGRQPWLPTLRELNLNLAGARAPRLGEVLCKYGRSTGLTRAKVDGEGIYRIVQMTGPSIWTPVEIEGFRLAPEKPGNPDDLEISLPGDSGACWISPASGEAVGLHIAGEASSRPDEEYALACNMPAVLTRLGLRLATIDDLIRLGMIAAAEAPDLTAGRMTDTPGTFAVPDSIFPSPGGGGAGWTDYADPQAALAFRAEAAVAATQPPAALGNEIWEEFQASLRHRYPVPTTTLIGIDDKLRDYFPRGDLGGLMRKIILDSPRFYRDRAVPGVRRLRSCVTFRDVCTAIADAYLSLHESDQR